MEILKIRNPKASFSYIKIKPHQEFFLHFASIFGNNPAEQILDFTWNSEYLECEEKLKKERPDGPVDMHFHQLFPDIMEDWAKYSSVVLGEICVVRPHGQSNLVIVLEQSTPKVNDILTIIDPDDITLTLRPKQILEIILSGDKGTCHYCATGLSTSQCFYHKVAHASMEINEEGMRCNGTKEAEGIYTVNIGSDQEPIRVMPKHPGIAIHSWYRNFLAGANWPAGAYNAGRIYCEGGENEGQINLNLKLRRKDTKNKGLSIPSVQNTVVPYCKNVILEEVGGEFEDCETVEYVGENKVIKTVDNRVIVCNSHERNARPCPNHANSHS